MDRCVILSLVFNTAFFGKKKFTAAASDWEEFLSIPCDTIEIARQLERHVKKMKSAAYIRNLKKYPEMVMRLKLKYGK